MIKNALLNKPHHFVNLSAFGAAAAIGQFMMMVFALMLARIVGPADYGFYVSSFSILFLTSIIFNNGLDSWLLNQKQSSSEFNKDFSQILFIKFIGGLIWGLLIIIIAPLIRPDVYLRTLLFINSVDIWTDAVFITSLALLNIQGKVKHYVISLIISRTLKLFSLYILLFLKNESIITFAVGRAIVSVITAAFVMYYLKPNIRYWSFEEIRRKLRLSRFFALSEFLATIYMQIDITLLNLIVGSVPVGVYSPASNIINAMFVLPSAIYFYTLPLLTKQYQDNPQIFIKSTKRIILLTAILGVLLSVIVFVLGEWFTVRLLGPEYVETSIIIVQLSPILLLKSLEFGLISAIVASGEQKRRIRPQILAALINIFLNILLIPKYGAIGAARTYLISECVLMLWYAWVAYKVLHKTK